MSKLKKEELNKLSVKQLEKYATGVDGEDLELVNEVIKEKKERNDAIGKDAGVEAETEAAKKLREEKLAEKAMLEEKKAAALKEKEEAKAAALKLKEEKAEEARKLKEAAAEARIKQAEERQARKDEVLKAKEEALKNREAEKVKREEERKEAMAAAQEAKERRQIEKAERARESAERLKNMTFSDKPNKTQQVRDCLKEGMSNAQIAEKTGFSNKFICDTVWRIERQIEEQEYMEKRRQEREAEKAAAASQEPAE